MCAEARQWCLWIERGLLGLGVACLVWWGVVSLHATRYQYEQRAALERMRAAAPAVVNDSVALPSGSLIGSLDIPRLRLSAVIAEGDDDATLNMAIGHLSDTPL